jgi:hypothetical protein
MTGHLTRKVACALALAWLAAPAAARAHEGEDHAKKGPAAASTQTPGVTPPQGADPQPEKGVDAERRAATRRKLADEDAAKQKEAAEQGKPPAPSGAPPGIGPK